MKTFALVLTTVVGLTLISTHSLAQIESVATPRAYDAIDEATLGTRDNDLGVPNGHSVTDITVTDIEGEGISLESLWSEQPLMVIFYRGGWCPFCNMQIREMSEDYAKFEAVNVLPVLISVDKPEISALTTATYEIPFPVLSDQDLAAHSEFNVVNKLSQEAIDRAASRGRDYFDWSGRDHESIAVASSFLVDTDGVVQWSTVLEDYRKRPTVDQLITVITDWQTAD